MRTAFSEEFETRQTRTTYTVITTRTAHRRTPLRCIHPWWALTTPSVIFLSKSSRRMRGETGWEYTLWLPLQLIFLSLVSHPWYCTLSFSLYLYVLWWSHDVLRIWNFYIVRFFHITNHVLKKKSRLLLFVEIILHLKFALLCCYRGRLESHRLDWSPLWSGLVLTGATEWWRVCLPYQSILFPRWEHGFCPFFLLSLSTIWCATSRSSAVFACIWSLNAQLPSTHLPRIRYDVCACVFYSVTVDMQRL